MTVYDTVFDPNIRIITIFGYNWISGERDQKYMKDVGRQGVSPRWIQL